MTLLSEQGNGEAPAESPHPAGKFLFASTPRQGEPAFTTLFFRHKRS